MNSKIEKIQLYFCLFVLAFITSLFFLQNPFVHKYMTFDTSVYQYIGQLVTEGYVPYRDVFDHKGPLVYLYYTLGYYVHPMFGVWVFEVISLFFSLVLAYQIAKKYLNSCTYVISTATILAIIPPFDSIGNTESMSFLPVFYAIFILQKFINERKVTRSEAAILGAVSAVLLLIKPTLLAPIFVFVIYMIGQWLKQRNFKDMFSFMFYGGMGGLIPLMIILGWLFCNHALKDFFDDYIIFNFEYMHRYKYLKTYSASFLFFSKEMMMVFIGVIWVLLCFKFAAFSAPQKTFIIVLSVALVLTLILVITPCNGHSHYLTSAFPLVLILFFYMVYILNMPKFLTLLMVMFLAWQIPHTYAAIADYQDAREIEQITLENISNYIRNNYPKETTIFMTYPDHCITHLYSERDCSHKYPLSHFAAKVERDKVISVVSEKPATLVIDDVFGKYEYLYDKDDYHIVYRKNMLQIWERN